MLKKQIEQDYLEAFRGKDKLRVSVLRLLKTAIKNKEIEKGESLTDEDVLLLIKSEVKKRKDSIESYQQGGRQDLVDSESQEKEILEKYLPAQLGEADVKNKIKEVVNSLPEEQKNNFGMVMGKVMAELKGQADGGMVNKLVKDLIVG